MHTSLMLEMINIFHFFLEALVGLFILLIRVFPPCSLLWFHSLCMPFNLQHLQNFHKNGRIELWIGERQWPSLRPQDESSQAEYQSSLVPLYARMAILLELGELWPFRTFLQFQSLNFPPTLSSQIEVLLPTHKEQVPQPKEHLHLPSSSPQPNPSTEDIHQGACNGFNVLHD